MANEFERCIRLYVGQGSGLGDNRVIPGNSKGPRPKEAYASLLLVDDERQSWPVRQQLPDGQGTADLTYRRAVYSLQFYREGAVERARTFDWWAASEHGLLQAETAFPDGHLETIRVLDGGSGYPENPTVTLEGGRPPSGSDATAEASVVGGVVARVNLTSRGTGYYDAPTITIPGGVSLAKATARGFGFRVVFPLRIRRLDEILGDAFEERAAIELQIDYAVASVQDTGQIDTIECEVVLGGDSLRG